MNHEILLIDTVTFSGMWFLIVPINILKAYSTCTCSDELISSIPEIGFSGTQNFPWNQFHENFREIDFTEKRTRNPSYRNMYPSLTYTAIISNLSYWAY